MTATIVGKPAANDHALHVALIQKQDKLTKAKALVVAYLEGTKGLDSRMGVTVKIDQLPLK